jgi:hypothetical protein
MKFDPVGSWEYSAPSAPEGYTMGQMVIAEKEDGYSVTIVFNEYSRVEAERVEFSKKNLKFIVYVEYEEVSVSGDFDKGSFTGTVNYSQGKFDFSAVRKVEQ